MKEIRITYDICKTIDKIVEIDEETYNKLVVRDNSTFFNLEKRFANDYNYLEDSFTITSVDDNEDICMSY